MFCFQCEQTAKGQGCTIKGVCGKNSETAILQDLIIYGLKGLSQYAHRARKLGVKDPEIDEFTIKALFSTVTNVNFDPKRLEEIIHNLAEFKEKAKKLYEEASKNARQPIEVLDGPANWIPANNLKELTMQGEIAAILKENKLLVKTLQAYKRF